MSQVARLWLPPASKAEEEAAIGKIVASWMQEWFKADHAILIERSQAQTLPRMSWRGTPKVQFGFEEGALERLGMAICADAGDLANPCDRAIFAKVGELTSLKPGDAFKLDRQLGEAIELRLNGATIAYGELVSVGDNFGVRIQHIADA